MGGTAPANQLRLSFTGSEDGEAETETCRAAKPLWRTTTRTSGPQGLNLLNRRMRTRMYGGVAGRAGDRSPYANLVLQVSSNYAWPLNRQTSDPTSGSGLSIQSL